MPKWQVASKSTFFFDLLLFLFGIDMNLYLILGKVFEFWGNFNEMVVIFVTSVDFGVGV